MEISPLLLAKMLLVSFLFGFQTGAFFDIGRALGGLFGGEVKSERVKKLYGVKLLFSKKSFPQTGKKISAFLRDAYIFIFDVLLVIFAVWGVVKINYSYNDGGIRFFTVAGVVAGFVCYYFTVSRLALFLAEVAVFALKYTVFSVFCAIFSPFSKIYNNLVKKIKKSLGKFRFRLEKKSKKVYNVCEILCENSDVDGAGSKVKVTVRKKSGKENGRNEEK